MLGPMRQAWINSLRRSVAEFLSLTLHYAVAGFEDRTDAEYQRLTLLEQEVVLTVNPLEDDHRALIHEMRILVGSLGGGVKMPDQNFIKSHKQVTCLAQRILKQEWNRIREGA